MIAEVKKNGGYFLSEAESAAVAKVVVTPQRLANPEIVGKPAPYIAEKAGRQGAAGHARAGGAAGRRRAATSRSRSRSCRPVLAFYVVKDWHEGCERVLQLLRYGGTGHTMAIHSKDDAVIREFALKKPVFRIVANTQSSMGATGYTTGLAPSMSLGCGAYAGNITSDNITPLHLINVKRLAYELPREGPGRCPPRGHGPAGAGDRLRERAAGRGGRRPPAPAASGATPAAPPAASAAVDFVAEDDVRRALREGRTIAPHGRRDRHPVGPGPRRRQERPRSTTATRA